MPEDNNPFPVTGYMGPATFCNREKEIALLRNNIRRGLNTTLFSIRRLGKTGLIQHLFHTITNSKTATIYVDVLGTANLREFAGSLATAIFKRFPDTKSPGRMIIDYIKSLRPVISYDGLSGQPEVSFEVQAPRQSEKTIQQIFQFLDKQNIKVVFAIDEFQQVLSYPEKNVEAILRSCIQQLKNTRFIFSGSNQQMMHEIFNSAKRPFFASCFNMHLDYISNEDYAAFIGAMFVKNKRRISEEAIEFILDWTLGHTYYTQFLCNYTYSMSHKNTGISEVRQAALGIHQQNESNYFLYRNLLSEAQWLLLTAIAKETRLHQAHSAKFIKAHGLGTSSMVTRGIEALLNKEMIFHNSSAEKPYYEVYDKFLMRWLQRM